MINFTHSILMLVGVAVMFWLIVAILRRAFDIKPPTWHCINCGTPGYGDSTECRRCGRYRDKSQYSPDWKPNQNAAPGRAAMERYQELTSEEKEQNLTQLVAQRTE